MLEYALTALAAAAIYSLGHYAGRNSLRDRKASTNVRDTIIAFQAMGYSKDDAQRLVREMGATTMRKAGMWSAE